MRWRCEEPVTEPLSPDVTLLSLAQAGDGEAFGKLTQPFRSELQAHCYRMLGSAHDAEDLLQETLIAAWRGISQFEGRSSLRGWLYRIATNQCLNALRGSKARALATRRGAPGVPGTGVPALPAAMPEPATDDEPTWLEPYPDELLAGLPDMAPGPEARYESRESISLAFITALQHLTPRQRAAVVLRDALGYRAAEAAEILDCSLDTVNGSLKRARAALSALLPGDTLSQASSVSMETSVVTSPRSKALVNRSMTSRSAADPGSGAWRSVSPGSDAEMEARARFSEPLTVSRLQPRISAASAAR